MTGQTNYACRQYISNVEGAAKVCIDLEADWLFILNGVGGKSPGYQKISAPIPLKRDFLSQLLPVADAIFLYRNISRTKN